MLKIVSVLHPFVQNVLLLNVLTCCVRAFPCPYSAVILPPGETICAPKIPMGDQPPTDRPSVSSSPLIALGDLTLYRSMSARRSCLIFVPAALHTFYTRPDCPPTDRRPNGDPMEMPRRC